MTFGREPSSFPIEQKTEATGGNQAAIACARDGPQSSQPSRDKIAAMCPRSRRRHPWLRPRLDQRPEPRRPACRLIEAGAIRVFTDIISGKRFERPGLTELIEHARPGDRLCVIRLDRLGRSLRELLETVDGLKARGIHLVSLEERLDTSSAAGELVFHVFGSIAHFERRLISERTRDGIAAARKRGRTPGRPPLDPETVSAAQKLIEAGLSPGQAAKQPGIGRATAYRIAKTVR